MFGIALTYGYADGKSLGQWLTPVIHQCRHIYQIARLHQHIKCLGDLTFISATGFFIVSKTGTILYKQVGPLSEDAIKGPIETVIAKAVAD